MTSKQHTIIAFLLISSLLSFFRIDIPGMTKAEEQFSLHWGILSIFGTTPLNADSWGAFADQAPYLSLGETPFVNPPLPMWGMVAWTKIMGETLPITRFLSCILAMISLISMYFISKFIGKAQHAMFASGFLAGSLLWNDSARQASPEIWGITFFLVSMALILWLIRYNGNGIIKPIFISTVLIGSIASLMLSSFIAILMFVILALLLLVMKKPSKMQFIFLISSLILGIGLGYIWFIRMDLPFFSQIIDSLKHAQYIPSSIDIQTILIDCSLLPFFAVGVYSGLQSLIQKKQRITFMISMSWFILAYVITGFSFVILPSFILIALYGLNNMDELIQSIKVKWICISLSFLIAACGIAPRLLDGLSQLILHQQISIYGIIPSMAILFILASVLLLNAEKLRLLFYTAMSRIFITLVVAAMIKVAFANFLGKTRRSPDALAVEKGKNTLSYIWNQTT